MMSGTQVPSNSASWYQVNNGRSGSLSDFAMFTGYDCKLTTFTSLRCCSDIAQRAYEEAVEFFKRELTDDDAKRQWVEKLHSVDDVLQVVEEAKSAYYARKKKVDKAYIWAVKLSKRVMHYAPVLDTLSQQHPAYTAIGWGALKFVIMVRTNAHYARASLISNCLARERLNMRLSSRRYRKQW